VFSEQFWPNNADISRKFLFLYAIWRTINGPQAAAGGVESSGFEWWPSGARVSCTLTASQPPILPSSSSQQIACFRYWTFVNRTTVDATWCHKIKSSAPWIFSLFFIFFISLYPVCVLTLLIWLHDNFPDLLQLHISKLRNWENVCVHLAGNFSAISIHFSLENNTFFLRTRKNVQQLSQKKNHHKTLTKANKKNPAIWNHLNNANWRLFLNALQSDVSSSKFKPHQSNSDLNFKFVELSQLSNEMILNYKQTFSAHFRWVQ